MDVLGRESRSQGFDNNGNRIYRTADARSRSNGNPPPDADHEGPGEFDNGSRRHADKVTKMLSAAKDRLKIADPRLTRQSPHFISQIKEKVK